MDPVCFDSKSLIYSVCGAAVLAAAAATTCACRFGRRYFASSHQDKQIEQIDALARIIYNNDEWSLVQGPFRTSGSMAKVEKATKLLRETPPNEYSTAARMLKEFLVFGDYEPTNVLKRLTYEVMEARKMTRDEVVRKAPYLGQLFGKILENEATTSMSSEALDRVFFKERGENDLQNSSMRLFNRDGSKFLFAAT
jgi:hypothetical protein